MILIRTCQTTVSKSSGIQYIASSGSAGFPKLYFKDPNNGSYIEVANGGQHSSLNPPITITDFLFN